MELDKPTQSNAGFTPPSPAGAQSVEGQRPIIVGISGASCSGKSWLAGKIQGQIPDASQVIDLDGYYRELEFVAGLEHGHDNPESIDFERAVNDLARLKAGQAVDLPVYCFENHRLKGFRPCLPTRIIVIEGLFVFADPRLREAIDVKIWMETGDALRLSRRIDRDTAQRERTVDEITQRYLRDVVPGFNRFVHPLREHADFILGNEGRDADVLPPIVSQILADIARISGLPPGLSSGFDEVWTPFTDPTSQNVTG